MGLCAVAHVSHAREPSSRPRKEPDADKVELLITVKAYPAVSQRHGEVVCVAGVRTDTPEPEWCRLFPVPFRDLAFQQRFVKYEIVSLNAQAHGTDQRRETLRPDPDSVKRGKVIDTKKDPTWSRRRPYVEPLEVGSMCEILSRQREDGTSLGFFRPAEILDFTVEKETGDWDPAKQNVVDQPSLLFPTKGGLEKIPYRFRYRYRCDEPGCGTHHQSIIDWELAQAFRRWPYPEAERLEKIRQLWLDRMWAEDRETRLFVGNQHLYPDKFLVLGVFWPRRSDEPRD